MFNTKTYNYKHDAQMATESPLQKRLRELMIAAGWSEKVTAEKAGLNQPTVHRIMSGESKSPRTQNLVKLAKTFGVSLGYLTGETNRIGAPLAHHKGNHVNTDMEELLSPAARKLVKQIQNAKGVSESDFLLISKLLERFEHS